jgi:hypothetical protein
MAVPRRTTRCTPTLPFVWVAVALLAYTLLPLIHAGHHLLLDGTGARVVSTLGGESPARAHTCCGHPARAEPSDQESPAQPHDSSTCDICKALASARKNVSLPAPSPILVVSPECRIASIPIPEMIAASVAPSPRSSRGPPQIA